MAETLVSTILSQLASLATEEVKLFSGVDNAVEKLTSNFVDIQAVLEDAESRQMKENNVGNWLHKLKDVSYDIEDVLDEWITASRKLQMKEAENASNLWKKVCSCIFFDCFCCKKVFRRHKIAVKIKNLNEKLDVIAKEKDRFKFSLPRGTRQAERQMTTSFIDLLEVCGRDHDKNTLINLLLAESSQGPTISTISIVGMGGIGKTTLARLVFNYFNDEGVNTHFDKKIWVCVSDPFDELRIAKAILESLSGENKDKDELEDMLKNKYQFVMEKKILLALDEIKDKKELETVLQNISQSIKDKKILLVLDDVWTDNFSDWEQIKNALQFVSPGSRILVTTRKESTAKIMRSTKIIQIGRLGDEESWSLFRKVAFYGKTQAEYENLKDIGRKLVGKCDGLPLAIKTLGSLLNLKTHAEQWQSVLDSDLWKLEEIEKELFPPILLSYYDLSSKLRKCFSFCAIFPKGYVIEKDILIKLWMAQGFLKVEGNKEMELVGEEYFEKLVMRSLFQDFERSEYDDRIIIRCKMHDIVHDFVQFVSKNECFNIETICENSYNSARYLMIINKRIPNSVLDLKKLRTFVVEEGFFYGIGSSKYYFKQLTKYVEQFTCLRTLNLNHCRIQNIPKGIKNLVHLRYLKLMAEKLPEVLCDLYNLQTLDVSDCGLLEKLPQGIGKLVNLRHLLIGGTIRLRYIPKGVERLSCLKTLNKFVISGDYGNKACTSLDSLKNFGSYLELMLGNVRDSNALKLADFQSTKNLLHLTLLFEIKRNVKNIMIMEALQPPPNLEKLRIKWFRGKSMSFDWMVSLIKLRKLKLYFCDNCEYLPPLGKLPSLESLKIEFMCSIKRVDNEFLGIENDATSSSSSIVAFPKLKFLQFGYLSEWEEWNHEITNSRDKDITIMPCLHSLSIGGCDKLKALPDQILQTPTLQQLEIRYCPILEERYKETGDDRSKISHIPKFSIINRR